jgi:putative membrane protein
VGVITGVVTASLAVLAALALIGRFRLGLAFANRPVLFIVALLIGLGNGLIGPVLIAIGIPVTVLTVVVAALLVNAGLLWLCDRLLDTFTVRGGLRVLLSVTVLLVALTQLVLTLMAVLFGTQVG